MSSTSVVPKVPKRGPILSGGWVQASGLVLLVGFFILGHLAHQTHQAEPPVPTRVADLASHDAGSPADPYYRCA